MVDSRCAIMIVVRLSRDAVERLLDRLLGAAVERARGFVEHEDRRILEQSPGDRDALLLAARELQAALADHRFVFLRKRRDEAVDRGAAAPRPRSRPARRPSRP